MKILRFSPNLAVVAGWLVALASLTVYAGAPQAAEYRSLLVGTRTGSVLVDPATGAVSGTLPAAYAQDVRAGRLYLAANNRELRIYDLNGRLQQTLAFEPVAQAIGLVAIGDGRIAVLDNKDDYVRFLDPSAATLATVPIPGAGGSSLQNLHGIVVGGELVVSENGRKAVFAIDLENYSARILKDLSGEVGGAWLRGSPTWRAPSTWPTAKGSSTASARTARPSSSPPVFPRRSPACSPATARSTPPPCTPGRSTASRWTTAVTP